MRSTLTSPRPAAPPSRVGRTVGALAVTLTAALGLGLGSTAAAGAATAKDKATSKTAAKVVEGGGLGVTPPATWTSLSIDDPKLADALTAAAKVNPQFKNLTPKTMKDAGIAFFAVDSKSKNPDYVNNVNGQVVVPGPPSLNGAEAELKASLAGQGAVVTAQTRISAAGTQAVRSLYKISVNALSGKKLTVYGTQVVLVKANKLYIVTISLDTADPAIADAIIASIKVK